MKAMKALALVAVAGFSEVRAETVSVGARSVIFAADGNGNPDPGGGMVPPTKPLPGGSGRILILTSVTGLVSPMGDPYMPPDGGIFAGEGYEVSGHNGIAGIRDDSPVNMFALLGVFTAGRPSAGSVPPDRDVTSERELAFVPTILNQPFFVGDGYAAGIQQRFQIPDGATGITFGFADSHSVFRAISRSARILLRQHGIV